MIQFKFLFPLTFVLFLFVIFWRAYGYAEIHYTFFGYSFINRSYPEILLDAPWRVDAGKPIPILCIVKDADKFPIKLERVTAKYRIENGEIRREDLLLASESLLIAERYWYMLRYIELPWKQTGNMEITLEVEFTKDGRRKVIVSDNLPGLSHAPFNIFISPCKFPTFDGWYYGDPHYHSDMTQNQVEFGAPAEVAVKMGKAIGLSWLAVTDHSYDLDVAVGEFFRYDPELTRWRKVIEDAELANSGNDDFVVIPAEEISCGNCKAHNVHLLAFNIPELIPGKGDGVKRGLNKKPDLTLSQVLSRITQQGGFAYASHPEIGNGFMGVLLLNRGRWRNQDYDLDSYSGLQFWNGKRNQNFDRSYRRWIQLLLEGRKLYMLGGSDAHGDFNRWRAVKYPNTKLAESGNHVFGKIRTYAYCGNSISTTGILDAIRNGRIIITDGPITVLQVENDNGRIASIGENISGRQYILTINVCSSEEFGRIGKIDLYKGDLLKKHEQLEKTFIPEESGYTHIFTHKIEHKSPCYVRVEAVSSAKGEEYKCFTNPIWLMG